MVNISGYDLETWMIIYQWFFILCRFAFKSELLLLFLFMEFKLFKKLGLKDYLWLVTLCRWKMKLMHAFIDISLFSTKPCCWPSSTYYNECFNSKFVKALVKRVISRYSCEQRYLHSIGFGNNWLERQD